jgi:hypothetical protein
MKKFDLEEQITLLTYVIRQVCEDNDLNKSIVIEDFEYIMNRKDENEET